MRSLRRKPLLLLAGVLSSVGLLLTVGCGGDDPVEPPPPVPTTISISPETAALVSLGETVQLTATVRAPVRAGDVGGVGQLDES